MTKSRTDFSPEQLSEYRDRTQALLRRYFRTALEVGRLPSLLGREFFRAKVTSYRMQSFEDAILFVHDIESCLRRLDSQSQKLIAIIALQGHDYDHAARELGCTWRTVANRFPGALDELSLMFLRGSLLAEIPCQEGKKRKKSLTDCKQTK